MIDDLLRAFEVIKNGGVILYPSDTGWSLGCDAINPGAVERIYRIKNRPATKRMTVLMENPALLDRYVEDVPEIAWDLIEISTTPLTLILPKARNLAHNLIHEDGSVSVRFTREKFSQELIRRYRKPIVCSSANIDGMKSPANFLEINKIIINSVDYYVNYQPDDQFVSKPSSIIKLSIGGRIEIIRQ